VTAPPFTPDPITFSVVLSRFDAIATEMTVVLERSAWSSNLALAHDYSCGIYDAVPRQVSMFDALPIHTTSMQLVVGRIAERFAGRIQDGDVFWCNDPEAMNTHIGDLVTAAPVFADGRLVFWSVTKGHQLDTGAIVASSVTASSQNVWQEGMTIPPARLVDAGVLRDDVLDTFLANVRYRDLVEGDVRAMLGSIERGRQRLVELCAEHGVDEVLAYVDAIIGYADRRMSQEVEAMPDGVYAAEGWVDTDGFEAEHIPVKVAVTVDGDRVTVDYTGSGPQGRGGVNGTYATAMAAGAIPFLYYISPDIPHNQGCIDHIDVIAPAGTICNARHPASTSCATIVPSDLMQDVVNRAMVGAMPERVPAGSTRCQNLAQFSGEVGLDGEPWGFLMMNNAGGFGASQGTDGWPLCYTLAALGAMKVESIEQIELLYPVRVRAWEIEPDSMGAGRWIGGPGNRAVVETLHDDPVTVITYGDGIANPPHGALGGTPGVGGGQYVESRADGGRRYVSGCGNMRLDGVREFWVGVSTGGGGFGDPAERDPEAVRRDVRDGIVSRASAREVHRVALSDGADPVVLAEETARLRERSPARPALDPTVPDAARWLAGEMRDGDVYLLNPVV
jgi:N-methylhydantoinase B